MPQTNQSPLVAIVASMAISFSNVANADPILKIENPYFKGGQGGTATYDCADLKPSLSCDFVNDVDGQDFCKADQIDTAARASIKQNPRMTMDQAKSNHIMLSVIDHNGETHFTCTSRYVRTHISTLIDGYLDPIIKEGKPLTNKQQLDRISSIIRFKIGETQESPGVYPIIKKDAKTGKITTLRDLSNNINRALQKEFTQDKQVSLELIKKISNAYGGDLTLDGNGSPITKNRTGRLERDPNSGIINHPVLDTLENKECHVVEAIQSCLAHPDF